MSHPKLPCCAALTASVLLAMPILIAHAAPDKNAKTDAQSLRPIPYEGALPSDNPQQGMPQKPLDANAQAALKTLYQRPAVMGPPPIAKKSPVALNITGIGPIIEVLPGPSVFADKLPPILREAMPEMTPYSNNVVRLPKGEVRITAVDRTANDTKLSQDEMELEATFTDNEGHDWKIVQLALAPLSPKPDSEPWFGGVATDMLYHGQTGNGTPLEPLVKAALLSWVGPTSGATAQRSPPAP